MNAREMTLLFFSRHVLLYWAFTKANEAGRGGVLWCPGDSRSQVKLIRHLPEGRHKGGLLCSTTPKENNRTGCTYKQSIIMIQKINNNGNSNNDDNNDNDNNNNNDNNTFSDYMIFHEFFIFFSSNFIVFDYRVQVHINFFLYSFYVNMNIPYVN